MSKRPKHNKRTWPRILAALIIICAAIILDSRFRLVTDEYTISSENIPPAFDGFKIVQLSDLHGMEFGRGNKRLIDAVSKAGPDIIILTGDFCDSAECLPELSDLFSSLTEIAPAYFVSGNHDWASGMIHSLADVLEDTGVDYLQNEYLALERSGERIILGGVEDPNGYADMPKPDGVVNIIRNKYPEDYLILLGHRNYWMNVYPDLDVDIIFCGHGHGGILRLPFIGGIVGTDFKLFPEYSAGIYENDYYKMVVSRGLGNAVPLPRFLNNPEIISVNLKSA
jgi:predicted MPP superfamily phosphohydrolase